MINMKTNLTNHKGLLLGFLFLILFVANGFSQGPNDYKVCIKNQIQTSPTQFKFDIFAEWTGTNAQLMQSFAAGINFNYAGMVNGGSITGAYQAGSADPSLPNAQRVLTWNINGTSHQIRMPAVIVSASTPAVAVPPPPGFRLGTMVVNNTVPFTPGSTPNFVFAFVAGTSTTTNTVQTEYLNGSSTAVNVTNPAFYCIENAFFVNPTCFTANPGGPYSSCGDVHLNGSVSGGTGTWSSSGTGTFDNASVLTTTYHPSAADLTAGSVTLTLTTSSAGFGCSPTGFPTTATFTSVDDNDACTTDGCDQTSGTATHTPVNTDDGDVCTSDDCNIVTGVSHTPVDVNDNNVCTTDGCDSITGPSHTAISVDDGNACTVDGCNSVTGPSHTAVNPTDFDPCTVDACDTQTGAFSHTPVNVDDGNACTIDKCDNGVMTLTSHAPFVNFPKTWADVTSTTAFTVGSVNVSGFPAGYLVTDYEVTLNLAHTWGSELIIYASTPVQSPLPRLDVGLINPWFPLATPDPAEFPKWEFGAGAGGTVPTSPYHWSNSGGFMPLVNGPVASPGNYVGIIPYFDNGGIGSPAGATKSFHTFDGRLPNGNWRISYVDPYVAGDVAPNTNGGTIDPPIVTVTAKSQTAVITHTPVNTDDGNACTTDACDTQSGVVSHTPVPTDDGNACTGDACDTFTGAVTHTPVNTDDGNACTEDACDTGTGAITHTSHTDDGNACTDDACDTFTGLVTHTPVNTDDGNACTADDCNTGTGAITHTPTNTDDGNACTDDACDTGTGAVSHTPVNTDDGNACTADACNTGTGAITHTQTNTDDGNACTTDACDTFSGAVSHDPVNTDDGDACTEDACNTLTGAITHTSHTDDGNACTDDACDTFSGSVTHTPVNEDDGNACTTDGCNTSSGVFHTPVNINDNNPCTIDACDTGSGAISHTDNTPTVTATAGTIACYQGTTCVTVSASGGQTPYSGTGVFCGYGMGDYSFDVTDGNGCVATSNSVHITQPDKLDVTVSTTPSGGADGTATASVTGGTGSYAYLWTPGGQTTNPATGLAPGNYQVKVTDDNGCTATASGTVGNSCNLSAPGPITGADAVCKKQSGLVYCAAANAFATSYAWTLPAGIVVVGANNGQCITVKVTSKFKGGFVCVKAITPCGTTAQACKNVLLVTAKPTTPGTISGPATLCKNATGTYSISPIAGATSYTWSINNGGSIISGQGTTTVVVKTPSNWNGGDLKVKSVNCKDHSGDRHKTVGHTVGCRVSSSTVANAVISTEPLSALVAYPNPTNGKATISFTSDRTAKYSMKVVDMIGKVLINETLSVVEGYNMKEINLENMSKGIYMISVQTEEGNAQTLRLIVE